MCGGGAWGQEVHRTSHAAFYHEKAYIALLYWRGKFGFNDGLPSSTAPGNKTKKTQQRYFLVVIDK